MTECLKFHIGLASAGCAHTEFRLLNGIKLYAIQLRYVENSIDQ